MINNPLRMTFRGILLGLSLSSRLWSQTPEVPATLPDAGVSDAYLIKAGTSAVSILSSRLDNPQNEPYFEGIISRLKTIDPVENQRAEMTRALTRFAQRNSQRNGDVGKTVFAICSALETIGMRGGDAGIDFLSDWLRTDKYAKTVRCYRGAAKNPEETKDLLFACAARGLGFSGHTRGLKTLSDAQQSPPKTMWPENLKGAIQESIQMNKKIKKKGLSSVFEPNPNSSGKSKR
jgi:hypothetical protein